MCYRHQSSPRRSGQLLRYIHVTPLYKVPARPLSSEIPNPASAATAPRTPYDALRVAGAGWDHLGGARRKLAAGCRKRLTQQRLWGLRPEAPPELPTSGALGRFECDLVLALLGDRLPYAPHGPASRRALEGGGAVASAGGGRRSAVRAAWRAAPAQHPGKRRLVPGHRPGLAGVPRLVTTRSRAVVSHAGSRRGKDG